MSIDIECPSCARRYSVAASVQGKRVRCQQCGTVFAAESAATPVPATTHESLDLVATDLSQLPKLPAPSTLSTSPLGTPAATGHSLQSLGTWQKGVSNPSGGPSDTQMRLVCGGMLAMGVVVSAGSFALGAAQGIVYLGIVILLPLMFVLGIAGLISPNVIRAVGKYGGHLPGHYKAIGWGVLGLCFVLMILLMAGLFLAGFEPDRPGSRNRAPGLTRSQTATVIDRISKSYESSPNANVVRTVSFPVFSLRNPQPQVQAEQALKDAPGYVAGSFQLGADRKSITFQYRGEKDIAIQYALLLPGPTGIFIEFSPQFEE